MQKDIWSLRSGEMQIAGRRTDVLHLHGRHRISVEDVG